MSDVPSPQFGWVFMARPQVLAKGMTPEDGASSEEQCWVLSSGGDREQCPCTKKNKRESWFVRARSRRWGSESEGFKKFKSFHLESGEGKVVKAPVFHKFGGLLKWEVHQKGSQFSLWSFITCFQGVGRKSWWF